MRYKGLPRVSRGRKAFFRAIIGEIGPHVVHLAAVRHLSEATYRLHKTFAFPSSQWPPGYWHRSPLLKDDWISTLISFSCRWISVSDTRGWERVAIFFLSLFLYFTFFCHYLLCRHRRIFFSDLPIRLSAHLFIYSRYIWLYIYLSRSIWLYIYLSRSICSHTHVHTYIQTQKNI